MIECAVWWAVPLPNEPGYLDLLDDVERGRHRAYRQEIDQRRFLTGRVLAKTVAAELLGRAPADVAFDATCDDCGKPHGRPRVPGAGFDLSISHSGERIGVAVTSDVPVGLDVETATRRVDDSLIAYALNDTEQHGLDGLPEAERVAAFFRYWTGKEALMKATGRGLRIPLRSITLAGPDEPPRLVASNDPALDPARTRLADLDPGEGYRAAIAVLADEDLKVTERWWSPTAPTP
ncbi:4'-phosphopantetheinyl transferase [Amycolatopsis deserti]|uniref:4'-phosphopantetheinyl transferase n=1 Tax=Amycolatopsis deserti TaxID=185696 RepID=A0ABQ3J2H7_9PSEU|nr:4'-phosphopantetheinyl transferase superfamily protein [Amycolatopsis deserti]GHF01672.1 4'-phosphopantetheinyl transferase [Amycolatopsis deserti]